MSKSFHDPSAILITGSSSGIGEALALDYAAPGRFLALSGRNVTRLEAVAEACRKLGAQVQADVVDVADRSAMARWFAGLDDVHPLDLVVANAGIPSGTVDQVESEEQVRDALAVNLTGVVNTVWPAIARMRERGRGQLAIISSLAGFRGLPTAPAYSASKAAVKSYGEALRGWLEADGIRVSVVLPGYVRTRMTEDNPFPMPFIMDPDKAARIIRHGLKRDKARIAFPWPTYMVMWLMGALPPTLTDPLLNVSPKID